MFVVNKSQDGGGGRGRKWRFTATSGLQNAFLCSDADETGGGGGFWGGINRFTRNTGRVLISRKSRFFFFPFWTSHLMFWRRYPCKRSGEWMLRAPPHPPPPPPPPPPLCTWIVKPVGDHLILRRWWLTRGRAFQVVRLFDAGGKREKRRRPRRAAGGGVREGGGDTEEGREKAGRNKYKETDGESRRKRGRRIPHKRVLVMCAGARSLR